jgi:tetratricopeptide (TPR) repeat protein
MARRRKSPAAGSGAALRAAQGAPRPVETTPVEEPAFWFGFEVSWAKLAIGRVALFGVLACDAVLQLPSATQHSGFNIAHVPGLDALAPTRALFGVLELVSAYLFVLIACGVATRFLVPIAASLYAWMYFSSQIDEYQHHYLVSLVLLVACFVPWERPPGATASTPVRSWALRLLLVEVAIVYLWAAISKMDPSWVDGASLAGEIHGPMRDLIDDTIGLRTAARATIGVELALAATVWRPRTWWLAAPLGILLHLGFVVAGLKIGLFAWMMLALYVLVVPDRIWIGIWSAIRDGRLAREAARPGRARPYAWPVLAAGLGVGFALVLGCRLESSLAVATALSAVLVGVVVWRRPPIEELMVAHVLALATWVGVDRATRTAAEYYRGWGDSARRLHDLPAAEHAYRKVIEIVPDWPEGHHSLAMTLLDGNRVEEGLEELHRVEALDGSHARVRVIEAMWLARHGRMAEAIAKAREATVVEPADAEARRLLSLLTGDRNATGAARALRSVGPRDPNAPADPPGGRSP